MARVIVEYNIVVGNTRAELIRNVGAAIRDNFEPLGSFVVLDAGLGQAVVRYEDAEDDIYAGIGGFARSSVPQGREIACRPSHARGTVERPNDFNLGSESDA